MLRAVGAEEEPCRPWQAALAALEGWLLQPRTMRPEPTLDVGALLRQAPAALEGAGDFASAEKASRAVGERGPAPGCSGRHSRGPSPHAAVAECVSRTQG